MILNSNKGRIMHPDLREKLNGEIIKVKEVDQITMERLWNESGKNNMKFEDLVNFVFNEAFGLGIQETIKIIDSFKDNSKLIDFKEEDKSKDKVFKP